MAEADGESSQHRRMLAAIVFTDIVNFSGLTRADEDRALRLVRRDLELIRGICRRCNGKVLKSTGDGLLMYFDSAVQAVAFALQAQEALALAAEELSADEVLQHRIGIHLGDVFVTDDDVMGDGVNVAARLQAEAPPGGICISQTVYDVVKNRLAVKATYLGPRELKNIKEAVPVYQILLEAASGPGAPAGRGAHMSPLRWTMAAASAFVAGAAVVVWLVALTHGNGNAREAQTTGPPTMPQTAPMRRDERGPTATASAPASRSAASEPVQTAPPRQEGPTPAEVNIARQRYLRTYDVAGMVRWLRQHPPAAPELLEGYQGLEAFLAGARPRLIFTRSDAPLAVDVPSASGPVSYELWGSGQQIVMRREGRETSQQFDRIPHGVMARVLEAFATTPQQREAAAFFEAECRAAGLVGSP